MKGGWSGTGKAIVQGLAAHHPPAEASKPAAGARLREVTFTYKIDSQDGPRFWGTMSSPYRTEPVIGVVADNDTIDTCFRQRLPDSAVAACNLIKRSK